MRLSIIVLLLYSVNLVGQKNFKEADYTVYIQSLIGGELEVSIKSGRIDLLTSTHAFEIERAAKWKQSIGQSIWYALNTNKKAGIILLLEDSNDYKYLIQLTTALEYANLKEKIEVFAFPNDFKHLMKSEK